MRGANGSLPCLARLLLKSPESIRKGGFRLRRPSFAAILLGFIPFVATCFSVSLWDRIHPMIFGLPFNMFWLILWLFLTPLFLLAAYRIEGSRAAGDRREQGGSH